MITRSIKDYATLTDYERAKDEATDKVISRQSRGSIAAQNDWYMTEKQLKDQSKKADKSMTSLRKAIIRYRPALHSVALSGGVNMPSKTPRQARAMRAAAAGKSTLGIPKKVGKEFVKADKRKARSRKKGK